MTRARENNESVSVPCHGVALGVLHDERVS